MEIKNDNYVVNIIIAIPLIVIKIGYCLKIEGYNITSVVALFGVFLSSLGVYYSNEKSNERIVKQLMPRRKFEKTVNFLLFKIISSVESRY